MMMNEQLTMFKCKSNWNSHKNISYCASKLSTQKMLKQIKFQLKDANNVNSKKQFKYANIPSMNNFEIMIFDIVSFFFVQLHLLDSNVQSRIPHATLKGFA